MRNRVFAVVLFFLFPFLAAAQPLINTPEVAVAEATGPSGANVFYDVSVFSFVDPSPTVSCLPASGSLFALGTTTVNCTGHDSGGTSFAQFPVVVTDSTPPVITVPAPFISSTSTVTYTVTATDLVDGPLTPDCSPASGSVFPTGVTTVNCTATDSSNNTGVASFQVSVQAPPPPTLTLPADFLITIDPFSSGQTVGFDVTADEAATVSCTPPTGSFFPVGTTTVSCTATNVFGGTSTGTFTVTIQHDPHPVLVLPASVTVEETSPSGDVATYTVSARDEIDGTIPVTCTPPSGSTFAVGTTEVQCSATNSRGFTTTGSFSVFVHDTTPPVLSLPAPVFAVPTSPSGAVVNFTATAHDNISGDLPVTCDPASGSTFPIGTTTVVCSATDGAGNFAGGTFDVTVSVDTTPPVITVPANITAEATGPSGAAVTYTVTAIDDVDGPVSVSCTPISGSTFPLGTTNVLCSASDAAGNTGTASFTVTVVDTTPPTLHLPDPITVSADANCSALVTYSATATDLVDLTDAVTCTPPSGSIFSLGTRTVNCSSTDAHGNTATGSFTVTVNDTTPPTIQSVTATPNNLWPPNHKMVDVVIAVVAVDNCDSAPVSHILGVTANQPINGPGDGNTTPDWVITGPLTLQLRAERAQGQDRIYTITVASTDFSGNTSTATTTVTVSQTSNGHGRAVGH